MDKHGSLKDVLGSEWLNRVTKSKDLLGKTRTEFIEHQRQQIKKRTELIEGYSKEEIPLDDLIPEQVRSGLNWYGGAVFIDYEFPTTVNLTVLIKFADGISYRFRHSGFGLPCHFIGIGGGAWTEDFQQPEPGREMAFEYSAAAIDAGGIQITWWDYERKIVGSFVAVAEGFGLAGGGGTESWERL
jgi:hypothetical protein